jgi:hypothetical protein
MMAKVACFCGCTFSFDGGAGACPRCGEAVSLTGALPEILVRDWPGDPVPARTGITQEERLPDTWTELVEAGALSGLAAIYSKASGSPAP